MSANNWRACPGCLARLEREARAAEHAADAAYGKVALKEFNALRKRAQTARAARDAAEDACEGSDYATLAEYYQIYTHTDGTLRISYSAGCRTCGYDVSFEHSQSFPPEKPKDAPRETGKGRRVPPAEAST